MRSIADLTCVVEKEAASERLDDAMRRYSRGPMNRALQLAPAPTVSQVAIGSKHRCVFNLDNTFVKRATLVRLPGRCDNEWGSSKRIAEMTARLLRCFAAAVHQ